MSADESGGDGQPRSAHGTAAPNMMTITTPSGLTIVPGNAAAANAVRAPGGPPLPSSAYQTAPRMPANLLDPRLRAPMPPMPQGVMLPPTSVPAPMRPSNSITVKELKMVFGAMKAVDGKWVSCGG